MNEKKLLPIIETSNDDAKKQKIEYIKLFFVFLAILIVSILLNTFAITKELNTLVGANKFLAILMGVFFLTFAAFKLINLKSFAHGFAMYDIIAKRSKLYSYAYPFIQLIIGIDMFLIPSKAFVQLFAAVVSLIALIGVYFKWKAKEKIHCACLGNVIKMPLSTVTLFEDGTMFVIATYMLFAML